MHTNFPVCLFLDFQQVCLFYRNWVFWLILPQNRHIWATKSSKILILRPDKIHTLKTFTKHALFPTVLEANYTPLAAVLERNVQFKIPIYQRTYDWHREHCKQLFDDIVRIGQKKDNSVHFLGTITYVNEHTPVGLIPNYQIIDGQQRLTTLMLLLKALQTLLDERPEIVTKEKINQLLFNVNEKNDSDTFKLVLTDDDNNFFKDMLKGDSEESSNIASNFKYFKTLLANTNVSSDEMWLGIKRLTVVTVMISDQGDPQAIFESMNSTGLSLSDTDMIQNYFLMPFDSTKQKEIYERYWKPMERDFPDEWSDYFDEFLRNYLMMRRGSVVPKRKMYAFFKKYMRDRDREEEIKKISYCSKYYANLIGVHPHSSKKINTVIEYIRMQDTNIAHAFLLKVLIDHAEGKISEDDVVSVFMQVDSYLLRCHVCETAKGGNKVFPELITKINAKNYGKSIEDAIMSKGGNRRFPRNVIFKEKLQQCQLYNNRTMCHYMLARLEHKNGKEMVRTDDLQIEHIMPQHLTDSWRRMLGSEHEQTREKYLHTIGNLTLTGYNSELGNLPFDKKCVQYKESKLRITQEICKYENWDDGTIKDRAESLISDAIDVWECPAAPDVTDDSDDMLEEEYLDGKEIVDLWDVFKAKIELACDGAAFYMRRRFGTFRLDRQNTSVVLCSM